MNPSALPPTILGATVASPMRETPATPLVTGDSFAEYNLSFFSTLVRDEDQRLPIPNFMHYQTEVTEQMRRTLVHWMSEVSNATRFCHRTLHLSINCVDRYLSARRVPRTDLQLLGCVSLFVASKYEELPSNVLTISHVVRLCAGYYTRSDVHEMENRLLRVLNYDLGYQGCGAFLDSFEEANCLENPRLLRRDSGVDVDDAPPSAFLGNSADPLDMCADVCTSLVSSIPRDIVGIARSLIESSLVYSAFSSAKPLSLVCASLLAAEAFLESRGVPNANLVQRLDRLTALEAHMDSLTSAFVRLAFSLGQ
ncbi:hypothetical protein M427DRAFT_51725, partial [Gonapodya prolifera JEL478]